MTILDTIKKSYKCVVENPSITMFFVIFLIGANILISYILSTQSKTLGQILILCLFALICIFISGWFKVIQESMDLDNIKEKKYYALFLEGIGENIIPTTLGTIIYSAILFLIIFISQYIALKQFGSIDFVLNDFNSISQKNMNFMQYFQTLTSEQKYIIYGWNFCILCGLAIFNFAFLFYFPALILEKVEGKWKNIFLRPLIALWKNLKFFFKNFLWVLLISISIHIIHMILAILNAHFAQNLILSVVFLLIYIYFVAMVVMFIFNYYDKKNNYLNKQSEIVEKE